jgi:hypothetical protein
MADTRRELILARLKTNLDTIAGATVYRSRVEPLARGEVPAVIVEAVSDQPTDTNFFDKLDWICGCGSAPWCGQPYLTTTPTPTRSRCIKN